MDGQNNLTKQERIEKCKAKLEAAKTNLNLCEQNYDKADEVLHNLQADKKGGNIEMEARQEYSKRYRELQNAKSEYENAQSDLRCAGIDPKDIQNVVDSLLR